ncbi:MAG: hypothetical protein V7L23_33465 [Nostoc sp.]
MTPLEILEKFNSYYIEIQAIAPNKYDAVIEEMRNLAKATF